MAIDTLIIGGINTHACIRTSAVDAFMRDYRVIIPEECVVSYNPEYHETSMKYFSKRIAMVLGLDSLIERIEKIDFTFQFS
jgi:isochorismate hydrolase